MKHTVFIQTNHKQVIGALVSAHSLTRNSPHGDRFDVRIMHHGDHAFFQAREGQEFLRGGQRRVWRNDDLQSFTPLRFMPPDLMGYKGRALVIDPDIFAAGDVYELLTRDMQGKALLCRQLPGERGAPDSRVSSVMLLDCARLRHWRCEEQFDELFRFERDYLEWVRLQLEPRENIGFFEAEWNDFDHLDAKTKLLHTTRRRTQPWKTGLPRDFTFDEKEKRLGRGLKRWVKRARRWVGGEAKAPSYYEPHPDPNQERFFFTLLRECLEQGTVSEDRLREEIRRNHVRHDALEILARTPPSAATPRFGA